MNGSNSRTLTYLLIERIQEKKKENRPQYEGYSSSQKPSFELHLYITRLTYRRDERRIESVFGKPEQDASFPHARITYQQQFE